MGRGLRRQPVAAPLQNAAREGCKAPPWVRHTPSRTRARARKAPKTPRDEEEAQAEDGLFTRPPPFSMMPGPSGGGSSRHALAVRLMLIACQSALSFAHAREAPHKKPGKWRKKVGSILREYYSSSSLIL